MTTTDVHLPVLDAERLRDLAEGAGQDSAARFFATYLRMLPSRTSKLRNAVLIQDPEMVLDALLSLKTSSLMAGALRMAQYCGDLEGRIKLAGPVSEPTIRAGLAQNTTWILSEARHVRQAN